MPFLWGEGVWGPGLWGAQDNPLTFDALTQYYMNLLIIQYITKKKAVSTVGVFSAEAVAQGIFGTVQDGFSLT